MKKSVETTQNVDVIYDDVELQWEYEAAVGDAKSTASQLKEEILDWLKWNQDNVSTVIWWFPEDVLEPRVIHDINEQKQVNREHETMDFVFKPENMSTKELLRYAVVTPEYKNKLDRKKSQLWLSPDSINASNSVFVNLKDHNSIKDKRNAIAKVRKKANRPILISADFEWGYVRSFDKEFTQQEIKKYNIPQSIIDFRNEEAIGHKNLSAFPSAEFLGKKYKDIVLNWTHEARLNFIRMMEQYWESVRKIMEDIWVDIVYWPCVDIVPDFEKSVIAKDDRSFGDNFLLWQDLISGFINGFQDPSSHVLLVPKHYVWVWASESDPHKGTWSVDKNRDSWTELVFKNLINGENSGLNEKKNENAIKSYNASNKNNEEYETILQKNKEFIEFLKNKKIRLDTWENIKALMTTHAEWLWWINETITYSPNIIWTMKSKVWNSNDKKMWKWLVFSDDLAMDGANQGLPSGIEKSDVNKILLALSSGHDVVLDLEWHSQCKWDDILGEAAKIIDNWGDIDGDWKTDLTREMLYEKVHKILDIMVKKWELTKNKDWKYQLKDATYFDPSISKVLRDSYYSNQWLVSGSSNDDYKAEWYGKKDIIKNKAINVYERNVHNFPNAVWKTITQDREYNEALSWGKKLVIVDKSECKMFIFTVDGKTLIEEHDVWVWRWTDKLDYTHDRRVKWDNKTPVWYYMIVDRRMGREELKKKFDNIWRYWWENWWMLIMVWPWTPYVWIHWTLWELWPSSNACVRVLDPSERWGDRDKKSAQKAINHLNEILPNGSFVIITN